MVDTKIQWTDATWNPTTGCTRASEGCDNCYAFTMTKRLAGMGQEKYQGLAGNGHFNGVLKTWDDALKKPLRWRKPRMVFVNSMSDLFHKDVPFEFIDRVFAVMAICQQHTFQVLTKRAERMAEYFHTNWTVKSVPAFMGSDSETFDRRGAVQIRANGMLHWGPGGRRIEGAYSACDRWPLPNVWLGVSAENQEQANKRIPHLLRCPAAVRFVSAEPLLGPIDFKLQCGWCPKCEHPYSGIDNCHATIVGQVGKLLHWIIVGAESGPQARRFDVSWPRSIVNQCRDAWVSCFLKQFGATPVDPTCRSDDDADAWLLRGAREVHRGPWGGLVRLADSKGGDPAEWPSDLRVREWPLGAANA